MLRVGFHALEQGPLETVGTVPVDDALFAGVGFELGRDVAVSGCLTGAGPGQYYWRGQLETIIQAACRRCLAPVSVPLNVDVNVLFTEDEFADDPAAYSIPARASELDMSEAVSEELILAVPRFVLCDEGCHGMCARCGADLNHGRCACKPAVDARWAALQELGHPGPEKTR